MIHIGKHLSGAFPIQNNVTQDALSPVVFNFALQYATIKVKGNQESLQLNNHHLAIVMIFIC
jgi:hypothetical protein